MVKLEHDAVKRWWLLLRDILLFGLGMALWWHEGVIRDEEIREIMLMAGGAAMAIPFTLWQDKKES